MPRTPSNVEPTKKPIGIRHGDVARYELYCKLVRRLGRAPTIDELRPIFADTRMARLRAKSGRKLTSRDVQRTLDGIRERIGSHLGARDRIQSIIGVVAEKAVAALDEQLDPETRSKDARMVKAVADAAKGALEVAGHSQEQAGGGGVHVHVGPTKAESDELLATRRRIHALERERSGIPQTNRISGESLTA